MFIDHVLPPLGITYTKLNNLQNKQHHCETKTINSIMLKYIYSTSDFSDKQYNFIELIDTIIECNQIQQ